MNRIALEEDWMNIVASDGNARERRLFESLLDPGETTLEAGKLISALERSGLDLGDSRLQQGLSALRAFAQPSDGMSTRLDAEEFSRVCSATASSSSKKRSPDPS